MRTAGSESLTADVNATTVPAGCTALQSAAKQRRRRAAQQQQPAASSRMEMARIRPAALA